MHGGKREKRKIQKFWQIVIFWNQARKSDLGIDGAAVNSVIEVIRRNGDWRIKQVWEAEHRERRKQASRRRNHRRRMNRKCAQKTLRDTTCDTRAQKSRRERNIRRFQSLRRRCSEFKLDLDNRILNAGITAGGPLSGDLVSIFQKAIPSLKEWEYGSGKCPDHGTCKSDGGMMTPCDPCNSAHATCTDGSHCKHKCTGESEMEVDKNEESEKKYEKMEKRTVGEKRTV